MPDNDQPPQTLTDLPAPDVLTSLQLARLLHLQASARPAAAA